MTQDARNFAPVVFAPVSNGLGDHAWRSFCHMVEIIEQGFIRRVVQQDWVVITQGLLQHRGAPN